MASRPSPDLVFAALAHPVRRRILDLLVQRPGASVKAVASHFTIGRIAVMKHLGRLEEAGLLTSEKVGRTRRLYFNHVPIQEIYDRWTDQYAAFWSARLTDIRARVEARHDAERKDHA